VEIAMFVGDYLGRREIYSPEALAIIDAGKTPELRLTYRAMNSRAKRLANWLQTSAGVRKGDRVAILARDGVEHLDCLYACSKLGAIHTALNWRSHWRELEGIVRNTSPKVLLFSDDFKSNVEQLRTVLGSGKDGIAHYIHLEGAGVTGSLNYCDVLSASTDTPVVCESVCEEDILCLLFTGGTTGLPKGAMVSHRMINWNSLNTVIHDLKRDDVYLNVFPLFHIGGLFTYTATLVTFGGTTILTRQFDPVQVLNLIEREHVTVFAGVPTMYQAMSQATNWENANLSSLRFCTSGGAPLPVTVIEKYIGEKGVRFKQGFGMTEFGPGLFALAPEDAKRKAGSIGRPNFFVDVRVVDEHNHPLGPNQVGELVLKGPSFCSGYYNNLEATKAAVDAEGWFHTGDMVRHDEEWYFYVMDRKKDMFISGGENVYPIEIESILYRHPAVHQCAVVGVPDPKWGEVGVACIVLKPGAKTSPEEILPYLREHLAGYKIPKRVEILDALPLSSMGKILKRELRERFVSSSPKN
jgi:fatty-acyl-CoA synthase